MWEHNKLLSYFLFGSQSTGAWKINPGISYETWKELLIAITITTTSRIVDPSDICRFLVKSPISSTSYLPRKVHAILTMTSFTQIIFKHIELWTKLNIKRMNLSVQLGAISIQCSLNQILDTSNRTFPFQSVTACFKNFPRSYTIRNGSILANYFQINVCVLFLYDTFG